MRTLPLESPLLWFPLELPFATELLKAYIQDIENQVERGIADFREGNGTTVVGVSDEEDDATVAVHKGIHSGMWNLKSVFEDHFPSLQRRSALITLFSFMEAELDRLCDRIRAFENYAVSLNDITDKGIVRATTYLIKVVGLQNIRSGSCWSEIKNIQVIRNLIVHSDARIPEAEGSARAKILTYVQSNNFLEATEVLSIKLGYLSHTLITFQAFFAEIHAQLKRKYDA